ncbi:selenoprotein domain protein [Penicillium brasilianum]|uniref:Selenoprotein domain protein n=1 Tax=Penicillium brasilianum TaxID=104259 RepID=A0A1S9RLF0_PENBI|nr:selenoprotein domain protein [Penicillium brasilianum]
MTEPTAPIENILAPGTTASASTTAPPPSSAETTALERVHLPRIAIKFCTQCRWMLRAAYFAQELLSTFGTDLGEVALVPVTGGVFTVTIWHATATNTATEEVTTQETPLWDRKRDGGFPEVKALKSLVRNIIAPNRDLGHTDRALKKEQEKKNEEKVQGEQKKDCEDCV